MSESARSAGYELSVPDPRQEFLEGASYGIVASMEEKVVEGLNLSAVKEEYAGKWVALSRDYRTVIAHADSLQTLLKRSDAPEQVVMQVLPRLGYAPSTRG